MLNVETTTSNVPDTGASDLIVDLSTPAANAVGARNPGKDWVLDPLLHMDLLADPVQTAPLIRILGSDKVLEVATAYKTADEAALNWQAGYRFWGRVGIAATFVATIVGALYLFPFGKVLEQSDYKSLLLVLEIAALAIMFFTTQWLSFRGHHQTYLNERAKAELQRFALFQKVMAAPKIPPEVPEPEALPLLPLKLEYFRRFLFEDQLGYYEDNSEKNLAKARRAKHLRNASHLVYIIATAATLPAMMVILQKAGWIDWDWLNSLMQQHIWITSFSNAADKYLLGIGVLVSAVHTLTTANSRLELNERNAARYRFAAKFLTEQKRDHLELVRDAADKGDHVVVQEFMEEITKELTEEHIAWCMLNEIVINEG